MEPFRLGLCSLCVAIAEPEDSPSPPMLDRCWKQLCETTLVEGRCEPELFLQMTAAVLQEARARPETLEVLQPELILWGVEFMDPGLQLAARVKTHSLESSWMRSTSDEETRDLEIVIQAAFGESDLARMDLTIKTSAKGVYLRGFLTRMPTAIEVQAMTEFGTTPDAGVEFERFPGEQVDARWMRWESVGGEQDLQTERRWKQTVEDSVLGALAQQALERARQRATTMLNAIEWS